MYCMVYIHLNYGICASSTDYLYCLLHRILTQWVTFINQSHYFKPMQDHITQLCQSSLLKLALFPGSHNTGNFYSHYLIWSRNWLHTQPFPTCGGKGVGGTPLKNSGDKLHTLNLGSFSGLPHFMFFSFADL